MLYYGKTIFRETVMKDEPTCYIIAAADTRGVFITFLSMLMFAMSVIV